jgi:prefoldin beta subunit
MKGTEKKIQQLQMIEQSLSTLLGQRQKFQSQLIETESAIEELKNTPQAYKIVGNIMIKAQSAELEKDLLEKKKVLEIRIKTLEKQESQLKEKAASMQSEVMKELQK